MRLRAVGGVSGLSADEPAIKISGGGCSDQGGASAASEKEFTVHETWLLLFRGLHGEAMGLRCFFFFCAELQQRRQEEQGE